jgi:sugar lactone lactonase YvrE
MLLNVSFARPIALALTHLNPSRIALARRTARQTTRSKLLFGLAVALTSLTVPARAQVAPLPQAAIPTFSVAPGIYPGAQSVSIMESTPGATIYYTTDGTFPGTTAAVYSTPITVSVSEILVAVASAPGYTSSPWAIGRYLITSSTTSFIYTVAGTGAWGYSGDGALATSARLNNPNGVAVDPLGNLYIADWGNNVVRKVTAATGIITTIAGTGIPAHSGDGGMATSAELWQPQSVTVDPAGNLYIAESGDSVVRKVDTNGVISTFAGGGNGSSGSPTGATFSGFGGLACDSLGNVFIADEFQLWKVPVSAATITLLAGFSTNAGFSLIGGIAVDNGGNIFVSDSSVVRKVDPANNITIVAGSLTSFTYGDGLPATSVRLQSPHGVAVDHSGNLYIADTFDQEVRRVDAQSGIITRYAGSMTGALGGDGDPAISLGLSYPQGLTIDSSGNLYVVDSGNLRIRKITVPAAPPTIQAAPPSFSLAAGSYSGPQTLNITDSTPGSAIYMSFGIYAPSTNGEGYLGPLDVTGSATVSAVAVAPGYLPSNIATSTYTLPTPAASVITAVAGSNTYGFSGSGGLATNAQFATPSAITFDAGANMYIADWTNHAVWKVTSATGIITLVAGTGTAGYTGDNGLATAAELHNPTGVAVDKAGNLFIADSANNRVRKVAAGTGIISTIAGPGTSGTLGDGGLATSAFLSLPTNLLFDPAGNLYIADYSNERVRKITTATGIISTVAGGGIPVSGVGDGGPATSALVLPIAMALDKAGDLFIADRNFGFIRRVDAATGIITTVAGGGTLFSAADGIPATSIPINPQGVAVDGNGNIYFPDDIPFKVRRVDAATGILTTAAGNGYYGYSGNGSAATMATFFSLGGIAFDPSGNLYIADQYNYVVRKVTIPAVKGPVFSLAGGTYNTPQSLTLTDATPGAAIYYTYTTAGSSPSTASTLYTGPITINTTGLVEAIATAPGYGQSGIASKSYTYAALAPAAAPYFNLAGGTYHSPVMLTLTDTTPGVTIHYTTNGTTPTAASTLYTSPITIASSETVEAVAIATGYALSPPASKAYVYVPYPPATAPSFSLAGGTYNTPQSLTLTDTTPGATIYYTTNGTAPTTSSTVYKGTITIASTETVEAAAIATGYALSPVSSKAYTYSPLPLAAAPYFSLAGGHYATPQMLTLTDATPGAAIYYTTNGTIPTTSSTRYTAPITISTSETVIAIAAETGYTNSNPASKAYTIP